MKITLNVPEWAIGRHIYIFAGRELLAQKECLIIHKNNEHIAKYQPLKIKPPDGRCTGCGSCCGLNGIAESLLEDMKDALNNYGFPSPECPFITKSGCLLKGWIPFSCAKSICTDYKGCTERLEEIK